MSTAGYGIFVDAAAGCEKTALEVRRTRQRLLPAGANFAAAAGDDEPARIDCRKFSHIRLQESQCIRVDLFLLLSQAMSIHGRARDQASLVYGTQEEKTKK